MLLKKSTIALCSSGSLTSTISPPAIITSSTNRGPSTTLSPLNPTPPPPSPSSNRLRRSKLAIRAQWQGSRTYATVKDHSRGDQPPSEPSQYVPPAWPASNNPTPYDIFAQSRHAPYSKKMFYQLVKLYHPDRHGHGSSSSDKLSRGTKLERYRLVIAANTILSDPTKKRAYDLYGAGWGSKSDMCNEGWREMDRAWRRGPGSAAHNATWEDWERWYEQRDGGAGRSKEKQQPLYMSNGLFVASLAVFVVIGSWGQATRAGQHSVHLIEMRENSSNNISEDMWRRRREKAYLTREDRVENFLRQREGWGHEVGNESHSPKDWS